MNEKIKSAALALKSMLTELEQVEKGNLSAAIRFRKEIKKINDLMVELRNQSKIYHVTPSPNESYRMERGDGSPAQTP